MGGRESLGWHTLVKTLTAQCSSCRWERWAGQQTGPLRSRACCSFIIATGAQSRWLMCCGRQGVGYSADPLSRMLSVCLQSGLHYRFRLRAENSEGYSMWSHVAAATTAATVPGSPMGLTVIGFSRNSASLTWQPPHSDGGSPVTDYQVQLQAKTKVAAAALGSDWIIIFDGAAVATTFSALQAGCQYLVRVAARNVAGQGQFCIPVQLTTASDAPLPPPVPEAEAAITVSCCRAWPACLGLLCHMRKHFALYLVHVMLAAESAS